VDTLAALHAVDPAAVGLEDLGKSEGFLARQVRGWRERWELARTRELAVADEVAGWLERERPSSPAPTLVHNDWKLDNLAVAAARRATRAARGAERPPRISAGSPASAGPDAASGRGGSDPRSRRGCRRGGRGEAREAAPTRRRARCARGGRLPLRGHRRLRA